MLRSLKKMEETGSGVPSLINIQLLLFFSLVELFKLEEETTPGDLRTRIGSMRTMYSRNTTRRNMRNHRDGTRRRKLKTTLKKIRKIGTNRRISRNNNGMSLLRTRVGTNPRRRMDPDRTGLNTPDLKLILD